MDHWDPRVTDGFATRRQVILFDNAGMGASGGRTPDTAEGFAENVAHFLGALGTDRIDLLGCSVGGYVSQALVLVRPDLVRRLVLVGTKPRAGEMAGLGERVPEVAAHDVLTEEDYLYLFFGPSSESRDAGREFWLRRHERTVDVDPESGADSVRAPRTRSEPTGTALVENDSRNCGASDSPHWSSTGTTTSWCPRSTHGFWRSTFRSPS